MALPLYLVLKKTALMCSPFGENLACNAVAFSRLYRHGHQLFHQGWTLLL